MISMAELFPPLGVLSRCMALSRSALNKDLCPHGMICFANEYSVVMSVLRYRCYVSSTGDFAKKKAREAQYCHVLCVSFLPVCRTFDLSGMRGKSEL